MGLRAFKSPIDLSGIVELMETFEREMKQFEGYVIHAKEMTEEYKEFNTLANQICMELARDNVIHLLKDTALRLASDYEVRLTSTEKRLLPFNEFRLLFEERLFNIDFGGVR